MSQGRSALREGEGQERGKRTSIPARSVASDAPVTGEVLVEHDPLRRTVCRDLVNALRLGHLLVPRLDVGADEVENAFERGNHHALDVVRGVEMEATI
jgi:hypothetical protein